MALENGNTSMYMPVAPAYNGGGFGGMGTDGWWILLLLLFANGGWGMGGGAWGMEGLYPWMNNSQNINNGFRDQMLNDNITSIRDGVQGISTQLCNGLASIEQGANARQMADMQQMFALQSSLQNCCCENRAGIADLKYTVATENCADRTQAMQNTRDIIDSQTNGTRAILDKLCQLELDGVKAQVDAKNERISELQTQLNMATLRESQTAQNAFIQQGLTNEVDALYNRLNNCPVPTTPVYGRTPIFTCGNNGCNCNGNAFYN